MRERSGERVDDRRAVAVERAFRVARRARGVAQGRGSPLVELGPLEIRALAGNEAVVGRNYRERRLRMPQEDDPALLGQLRQEALDQWDERRLDEQEPVRGMIDDVDDLLVEQARVDRVAHRADAGYAVIELEMAISVPGQGADPVARLDAEAQQRPRELFCPGFGIGVGVAMDRAFYGPRHHLGIGVIERGVRDDLRDQQRPLRHQPEHRFLPPYRGVVLWPEV